MGGEWTFAEKPVIEGLKALGYEYVSSDKHASLRDGENNVLFRPHVLEALQRLNDISEADAIAVYQDLLNEVDNEQWTYKLRGNLSRITKGENQHKTIKLIDFKNPENNHFVVTSQLYVKSQKPRIPDVVVYVNGIPLVVVECKSPLNWKDKNGEAFEQITQYERDIPRLFYSNQFNLVTDGTGLLYGATRSPSKFFGTWKDPWPRKEEEFGNALDKGLWCLLEPSRLLDLIAHFIVFERDPDTGSIIKKICRYQQFRAVNKIIDRVVEGDKRKGLIWHTQGSGKSLTMVYAALKLKTHLTVDAPALANPNLMVLTDRIDLDTQIGNTFVACGMRNPTHIESVKDLHATIRSKGEGLTLLSTIFKFQGSQTPVENSQNWIIMVDECHRTQEKDLGAYLRATMPEAQFFGFTGTPIKKNDKDTFANFSVPGELYLDKYSIDDAVRDGATVPIFYTGRKTDWHIEEDKIDILFDQWFAEMPDDKLDELKKKGLNVSLLLKHPERIKLIAYDIWTHFKEYAQPDGFKAQIVAYDREAVILYKRALDEIIANDLVKHGGLSEDEAASQAASCSACVYSASQEDAKPSEDAYIADLRGDLQKYYSDRTEKEKVSDFTARDEQPSFLIVCDKLLTGFDAPIEAVMYLDKPLKDHSLLQAIARTNRVEGSKKRCGLIVDYIGVSRKLDEALASYREEDVNHAMRPLDDLLSQLRAAHGEVMSEIKGIKRTGKDKKAEIDAFLNSLQGKLDKWFTFRRKARDFIAAYEALSPDPGVLVFRDDLKWIDQCLRYGTQAMEKKEALDHMQYSHKIRDMLEEHVHATGLSTTIKLRHITDPDFWEDFDIEGKLEEEIKAAAIRKSTELRKVTTDRVNKNPLQYQKFSDRLMEILKKLEAAQLSLADELRELEQLAKDIEAEDKAHEGAGMSEQAYGVLKILEAFTGEDGENQSDGLAEELNALYANDDTAPILWHEREQLRRGLRQQVRQKLFEHGYKNVKVVAERIEEYALKHHAKG